MLNGLPSPYPPELYRPRGLGERHGATSVVPRSGVEPERPCGHRFLRPTRLPVPPPRRGRNGARQYHWPVRTAAILGLSLVLAGCGSPSPCSTLSRPTSP